MSNCGLNFHSALLQHIPGMRVFARSLCRDRDLADDLVQTALLMAWEKRFTLRDPLRLRPWLLQILRNAHLMSIRSRSRDSNIIEGADPEAVCGGPTQEFLADCDDVQEALARLAPVEREAIMLVAVQELTYEQAAVVCGCPAGTIKSRVSRARAQLRELLRVSAKFGGSDIAEPMEPQLKRMHRGFVSGKLGERRTA